MIKLSKMTRDERSSLTFILAEFIKSHEDEKDIYSADIKVANILLSKLDKKKEQK